MVEGISEFKCIEDFAALRKEEKMRIVRLYFSMTKPVPMQKCNTQFDCHCGLVQQVAMQNEYSCEMSEWINGGHMGHIGLTRLLLLLGH